MLSMGQLMMAIAELRRKVGMARLQATFTDKLEDRLAIAAKVLDEVEQELERIAD